MADDPKNTSVNDETLEGAAGGVYSYESLRHIRDGMDPEAKKEARAYMEAGLKVLSPAYGLASLLKKD